MRNKGFAFVAVLFVLVISSFLVIALWVNTVNATKTSQADMWDAMAQYAAEAGAEVTMARLDIALEDGYLSDIEMAEISAYEDQIGHSTVTNMLVKVGGEFTETITDGPFAGLRSLSQRLVVMSTATLGDGKGLARIQLGVKGQTIPIFQFGVFFEKDLELNNGPPMTFTGRVHSNANVYISSDSALYDNYITTPDSIFHDQKHSHDWENGIWIQDASSTYQLLGAFDSRFFPDAEAFKTESCLRFDCRVQTFAFGVDSLKLPLPPGVPAIEIIRPREAGDTQLEKDAKYAWKADWYVEINVSDIGRAGDNICAVMAASSIRSSGTIPSASDCGVPGAIFHWTWEAFYDGREGMFVDVLDIDINKLGNWIGSYPDGSVDILYITFDNLVGNDPSADGIFPVIRLVEGQKITWGPFTLATDRPVYIQGNYNADEWKPASVVGDAINILSNSWQDADQQILIENPASETWINVTILAGQTSSECDHERAGCVSPAYGGGFENFQRFREDWSPGFSLVDYHYQGSLISLHESVYAIGPHGGHFYDPPFRDWAFDTRFENPANLPPGTPVVGQVIRTSFRRID